jgi:putative membrane-bound dehydrogenase-like protein
MSAAILALLALQAAPRVPEGFTIEKVAGEPLIRFPMFAAFDERGRLFVAESSGLDLYAELQALTRKCRISVLEDADGDGRYEKARVFADKLVFPMGLAWRDGKLYVPDPPEIVTLEDTDGDGVADRRTHLLGEFGHTDNGSLHGLTFGPDGLLYFTMGEPDGYKIPRADGSVLEGKSGALFRCRPDGSDPEVLCRGFENLVEVIFTPRGEIIGDDNIFQLPTGGLRDALVHLLDGGLYPLKFDEATRYPVTGEPLGPITLFPTVALSGLMRYRGTAFPASMRGHLFSAQHNTRGVGRHALSPQGSTFRSEDSMFVTCDDPNFHPSDVLEDADGSLLVVDTGGWYVQHCPVGKIGTTGGPGGIYRVRWAAAKPVEDPWGLKIDWARASAALLSDPRPMVRDRAQRTLAARGDVEPVAAAVPVAREVAVWTLALMPGDAATARLRRIAADADPEIAAPAVRALGLRRDRTSAAAVARLLAAPDERLRLTAAEALARCGGPESLAPIRDALRAEPDRFLEHALIHAAYRIADDAALAPWLSDASTRVQQAALLLLDQPPRSGVAAGAVIARLSSPDPGLRRIAVGLLQNHPEWAEPALGFLGDWLGRADLPDDERRRFTGLILAFQSEEAVQKFVADRIGNSALEPDRRALLLEAISQSSLSSLPGSWVRALRASLRDADPVVRSHAVRSAAALQADASLLEDLAVLAQDAAQPAPLRLDALRAVVAGRPALPEPLLDFLIAQIGRENDPPGRLAAAQVLSRAKLDPERARRLAQIVRGDPLISPSMVLGESAGAPAEEVRARLAALAPLLTGGDPARGRAIFFGKKVACSTCHRVGDEGGTIGPDLTKIGLIRSGRDILESVVAPSSTFAQGYQPYRVRLNEEEAYVGILSRQSVQTIHLRDASGAEVRLRRDQIASMERIDVSIMPEGLDKALSEAELRDLLGFLQALR